MDLLRRILLLRSFLYLGNYFLYLVNLIFLLLLAF
jgi:hypothetical protein